MSTGVLTGISGGVDSAVCALLLKEKGYTVGGVNCSFFDSRELTPDLPLRETEDARAIADFLAIPFYVAHFEEEFTRQVILPFIDAYREGATPNPCIFCNRHLKFGRLLDFALEKGYEKIATGHYAIIEKSGDRYLLKKGSDKTKDQSYVLWTLTQQQLSRTLMPLGEYTKEQVRELALSAGVPTAKKKESQDICFIPDGDYAAFIEGYTGESFPHGDFVTCDGKRLGEHKGIIRYTVGQRRGLGLALPAPLYVKEKNTALNQVVLCDNASLFTRELTAKDISFIPFDSIEGELRVKAKVRYKHTEQWATVRQISENRLSLIFDEPQRAIAKGQSLVLYEGDYVVGGGIIE